MEQDTFTWQSILETIEERTRPEVIARELEGMIDLAENDEELGIAALGGFSSEFMVISAGMAAMYVLPPEDPTDALRQLMERLAALDFETGINALEPEDRRLVQKYVAWVKPMFANLGRVMAAVFGAYARGEYDLADDPNALILQAESHIPMEPVAALQLLGRAGAMNLRGKAWWWRWREESKPPLKEWIFLADRMIRVIVEENGGPLDELAVQRERWHQVTEQAILKAAEAEQALSDDDATDDLADELDLEDEDESADEELEELLDELFEGEGELPRSVLTRLHARREDAIPELIEIARDRQNWADDSEGDGWASIHAVDVLGELRAPEAAPVLIDILAQTDAMDILHDRAGVALKAIGTPAGRAVLDTLRYTRNRDLKQSLAAVAGAVGRDEPETFDTLARLYDELSWDELRLFVVWSLADLGDPRAIPLLERAWQDPKMPDIDVADVAEALRKFGVEPSPPRKPGPRFNPRPMRSHSLKLGRNDPCWCGSGKKYKHCHLDADERGLRH